MNPEATSKVSSGQNGTPLQLSVDDLNKDERRICYTVWSAGRDLSIDEIARSALRLKPTAAKANSRVRNGLRRTVRASLIARGDRRGKYRAGSRAPSQGSPKVDQPPRPPEAGPTSSVTLDHLTQRVSELKAGAPEDPVLTGESAHKIALVLVAAEAFGPRDTVIARATGLSRGFVIRRLKLARPHLPTEPTSGFWRPELFWNVVRQLAAS